MQQKVVLMSLLLSVSIVDFELVDVCRGALSCVYIITQSVKMSRGFS